MSRRPWPIIIISFIFLLMPVLNILGTFALLKMNASFMDYITSLFSIPGNRRALFNLIVPSLAASLAVYSVKKWSYPVFFAAILCSTYETFSLNPNSGMSYSEMFSYMIVPVGFNLLYSFYLLLPNVRAIYYNPRMRWWETKPRYVFSTKMLMSHGDSEVLVQMANISEGGVLALMPAMDPGSVVFIKMNIHDTELDLKAKVIYRKPDGMSHGVQFIHLTSEKKKLLKSVIKKLEADKCELVHPKVSWQVDLKNWSTTLLKTGKGLIPS
jgi:hypothetical protein